MRMKLVCICVLLAIAGCKEEKSTVVDSLPTVKSSSTEKVETKQIETAVDKAPEKAKSGYMPNMKSVSNVMAIEQYRKQSYYESIAAYLEGFRSDIYNDNIGYAWAFGWNISYQSPTVNEKLSKGVGLTDEIRSSIVSLSSMAKRSAPKVTISPEQGIRAVTMMRDNFEGGRGIRSIINTKMDQTIYDKLKPNEQAALVYHTYKVGPGGAAKYQTMIGMIREYVKNPTPEMAHKIGGEFKYSYMLRGQKMYDTRSGGYLAALFSDPAAYGAMIGANAAPKDLPAILAYTKLSNIDTTKPIPEQIEAQDKFNKVREEMLIKGEKYEATPVEAKEKVRISSPYPSGLMG